MYMHMHKGELLTLDITRSGVRILCRHGKIWITQEGDHRDYLLKGGQQLEMKRPGKVAITALEESQCFPEILKGKLPALQVCATRA